jgi:hypothetical protein
MVTNSGRPPLSPGIVSQCKGDSLRDRRMAIEPDLDEFARIGISPIHFTKNLKGPGGILRAVGNQAMGYFAVQRMIRSRDLRYMACSRVLKSLGIGIPCDPNS